MALEALIGDDASLVDQLDRENAQRRSLTQSMTKKHYVRFIRRSILIKMHPLCGFQMDMPVCIGLVASKLVEATKKTGYRTLRRRGGG